MLSTGLLQARYSGSQSRGSIYKALWARAPCSMFRTTASRKSLCDILAPQHDNRMKPFRIARSNKGKNTLLPSILVGSAADGLAVCHPIRFVQVAHILQ